MKQKTLLLLFLILMKTVSARQSQIARIPVSADNKAIILKMDLDFASMNITDSADIVIGEEELIELKERGIMVRTLSKAATRGPIPDFYHTVDETWYVLDSLHDLYPELTFLDTCGYSQRFAMPIPHFIISSNIEEIEDEPAALFTGVHHAREPLGNEICIYTIKWLLENYADNPQAKKYLDSMEIHFIPIVNPEGMAYIFDENLSSPWWRKNLRDNGNDGGDVNPDYDGVDLNRNYDWHWYRSGETDPSSWTYRGPSAASENETQAVMKVALDRKPVVGISYHSYGHIVYYPYGRDGNYPPDMATISDIANEMASVIGSYEPKRLGGSNQSSAWLYGAAGVYDFLVETSSSDDGFIPDETPMRNEIENNFNGLTYLLDRCFYSGIAGHIYDSITGDPMVAEYKVNGLSGDSVIPRMSDSLYGSFFRLLNNDTYSMTFSKEGYESKTIEGIEVVSDSLTRIDVYLYNPDITYLAKRDNGNVKSKIQIISNTITKEFTITGVGHLKSISIFNAYGTCIRQLTRLSEKGFRWDGTDKSGKQVSAGMYWILSPEKEIRRIGNMAVVR